MVLNLARTGIARFERAIVVPVCDPFEHRIGDSQLSEFGDVGG